MNNKYSLASLIFAAILIASIQAADAAVIRVNTTNDLVNAADGACSLREAIIASDSNVASGAIVGECPAGSAAPVRDLIRFTVSGLITPDPALGALPGMTDGYLAIDGWTAPGAGPGRRPRLGISCALLGVGSPGFTISSEYNIVRGFAVVNCGTGIAINNPTGNSHHNWLYGNAIGLTPAGVAAPNTNGIIISAGAHDNLVGTNGDAVRDRAERNIISGNTSSGITITSINTSNNRIAGNIIGADPSGTMALVPNQNYGVVVAINTLNNVIGANSDGSRDGAEGNLISGNNLSGIYLSGGTGTVIAGNRIGTNAAGDAPIPNFTGISILESASITRVGTNGDGISDIQERNIISGNGNFGIEIQGNQNIVAGNFIGLGSDGVTQIPNLWDGINIYRGPLLTGGTNNQIGGPDNKYANYISSNSVHGISQDGDLSLIECNIIGSDTAGGSAPNGFHGIMIQGDNNTIRANDITDHATNGVFLSISGINFSIEKNNLSGNTNGILTTVPGTTIVENNWWGDASGPFHPTGNPAGIGDEASDGGGATLDYDPWLASPATDCAPLIVPVPVFVDLPPQAGGPIKKGN